MVHSSGRENGRSSDRSYKASTNESRIARSYRSPPSSKDRSDGHRSRRDDSSPSLDGDNPPDCLSDFYKRRFGSHSPEDYLNLRMSQFDKSLSTEDIKIILEREFKRLAPFEIKIVRNPETDERLAYVNFEGRNCAKTVRKSLVSRLRKVLGKNIAMDPAGVVRDQEGKYIPDRFNRAAVSDKIPAMRGHSPPGNKFRRSVGSIGLGPRRDYPRPMGSGPKLNQDDVQAGRTLFVGNLPGDVRESELKRAFGEYGSVEDIDVKILQDNNAAYAFILMGTVEEAIIARQEQHDRPLRPGGKHCQLGYGKTQVSGRLIIGGLGSWTTFEMLEKAFEHFGKIESIDYEDGDSHAYIQFTETGPAIDATGQMKNFPLGGDSNKCITVDFIRDPNAPEQPKLTTRKRPVRSQSPDDNLNNSGSKKRAGPRTPSVSPSHSPTRAGYIASFEDFKDNVAATWKGYVVLKKAEYLMGFSRIFGREHILQEYLRDSVGAALKLPINQRLPVVPDLFQKVINFDPKDVALVLATEVDKPLEPLVKYLQEKNAAGVITTENACLYVFSGGSDMSEKLIKFFSPRIKFTKDNKNHLLVVIKKTQSLQQQKQQFLNNSGLGGLGAPNRSSLKAGEDQMMETASSNVANLNAVHNSQFLPPLGDSSSGF